MIDTTTRTADLRHMLAARRLAIQDEVQHRLCNGRTDQARQGRDGLEESEADIQGDLDLSLLQMSAETLTRIDEALARLATGQYGFCAQCDGEIAQRRLRALPFAVRCRECEERHEQEQGRSQRIAHRRGGFTLFPDAVSL
jgi:DnaK suppressor protein